jgi:hypothetical protein
MHHLPCGLNRNRLDGRFVLAEERRVDFDRGFVFRRHIGITEYRVHRADDLTLLTIDTNFRVDIELRRPRLSMDAGDGTNLDTRSIVGT